MKNIHYKQIGELKPIAHGLVDFVADGHLYRNNEWIPCEIGYTSWYSSIDDKGQCAPNGHFHVEPTYIFVKDGITESGNHYYKETIEL